MQLALRYMILYVENLERSITFYRDLLGLPVRAEHGTYVEFETGSTVLAINTRENVAEITGLNIPESINHSQTFELGFVVEDVNTIVEKLRGHEVLIISEPVTKPWGQIVAYVADPDGHFIEICSALD
ncbi:VOC family protein [Cytobacillus sp. Hz8]|uniref:VOC family protein n=1 Tax=Cytobacillus sp. Hz8 TaxID=3347168 RepID=UPI0035E0D2F3